ncbi:MAG: response regulator [Chloroflexi bacterium]|nr:response regulator [Chloroflexota bacterium]
MRVATVLIVDDHPRTAELLAMMFELEGYSTAAANDVIMAIESIQRDKPDALVVDVMMPGASGLALCRFVRNNPDLADLPIVILSAKSQPEDMQAGLEAGADVYLTKPVSQAELLDAVGRSLGRQPRPKGEPMREALEVDVDRVEQDVKVRQEELRSAEAAFDAVVEQARADSRLSPQAKQDKIREATERFWGGVVGQGQQAALAMLEPALQELELQERVLRAQREHEPRDIAEWDLASARARLVAEDCREWAVNAPSRILEEYQFAIASGDRVIAYLLEHYGPRALEAAGAQQQVGLLWAATREANPVDEVALAKVREHRKRLSRLLVELYEFHPPDAVVLVQQPVQDPPTPIEVTAPRSRRVTKPLAPQALQK